MLLELLLKLFCSEERVAVILTVIAVCAPLLGCINGNLNVFGEPIGKDLKPTLDLPKHTIELVSVSLVHNVIYRYDLCKSLNCRINLAGKFQDGLFIF